MKILYSIQATGNGHISRAMELLPYLQKFGTVDIFLSGANSTLPLEAEVKYREPGPQSCSTPAKAVSITARS